MISRNGTWTTVNKPVNPSLPRHAPVLQTWATHGYSDIPTPHPITPAQASCPSASKSASRTVGVRSETSCALSGVRMTHTICGLPIQVVSKVSERTDEMCVQRSRRSRQANALQTPHAIELTAAAAAGQEMQRNLPSPGLGHSEICSGSCQHQLVGAGGISGTGSETRRGL